MGGVKVIRLSGEDSSTKVCAVGDVSELLFGLDVTEKLQQ